MKDWNRISIIRSLMELMGEQLLSYQEVTEMLNLWDERQEQKAALQLTLEYEDAEDSVSIHEAQNLVNSSVTEDQGAEHAELS